jgi:hypothetical protein
MTGSGSVIYNSITYFISTQVPPTPPAINLSGSFDFSMDSVDIPTTGESTLFLQTPFTASGSLSGRDASFVNVFSLQFTGSGIATIELRRLIGSSQPLYTIRSISYSFAPEVPEPTSIALLGTGFVGLLYTARKHGHFKHR